MRPIHLALVILIAIVWGLNFVVVLQVVADLPPVFANAIRFAIVLVLLAPFLRPVPGRMARLIGVALVLGVVHFGLVFVAMSRTVDLAPVIVAAQTNVPFATLLAVLAFGERIGLWRTLGIALSFAGVLLIGLDPAGFDNVVAMGLILGSAFAYGLSANLLRKLVGVSAMTVQAWVAAMAVPGSLLVSWVAETGQIVAVQNAGWAAWGGLLYGAVAATIVGHVGMTYLFQRYAVTTVSPYMLMMPVFATAFAVWLADEALTWRAVVGGLVTISGVGLITLRNRLRYRQQRQARRAAAAAGAVAPPGGRRLGQEET
ncbi:hypothetical protein CCR85_02795 [Rhodothalassium salexigens]|uniref:DMT family transporter n=1 Tax=Rhodothalassium salexigens TaxID=1086 RepID=UPI00191379D6|nr:DMT family transporter [Rhodothalassium salexigens]MBK5910418.1 hypothetical protein [Rhodothalassium salexigens]